MDTITHAALGAGLCALVAPRGERRLALALGAVVANLPDLDTLALAFEQDPVLKVTEHRSYSHSLLVLPFVAPLLWWLVGMRFAALREAPGRWLGAFELALLSHPLLDAATVYGTQLFWPLDRPPVMGANLFIIDPFFTLPLLVGALLAWRGARSAGQGTRPMVFGLAVASAYFTWTVLAQRQLEAGVRSELVARNFDTFEVLVSPAPFNSVLWRVVVNGPKGYATGYYSYWWKDGRLSLEQFARLESLEREARELPAVQRLDWFTRGFGAVVEDPEHRILYTDLRMGWDTDYAFRYVVADRKEGRLVPRSPPEQLAWPSYGGGRLGAVWKRVFDPD